MKLEKKKKIILIAIIIVVLLIAIILIISKKSYEQNNVASNEVIITKTAEEENNDLIKKLKKVSESERIKIYIGIYFQYIEDNDYDSAYNLLYEDFKQKYFPTLNNYIDYIKEQAYSEKLLINYSNITMQGNYYITLIEVGDLLNSNKVPMQLTLIVKENNYNDFYLSFKL